MFTHDPYTVKAIEYVTGIVFLVLFVAFWRFVNGTGTASAPAWTGRLADWFSVPHGLFFHRGHGWARLDGPGRITVGMDDFAQQLVGPVNAVDLPAAGATLAANETGWTLRADGKAVPMRMPVSGRVVAVNPELRVHPELVNRDPYGRGWVLTLEAARPKAALRPLLTGKAARAWIERVSDQLTASMNPELGHLMQDGGMPVHGIARGIDEDHWDDVARRFLE